MPTPFDYLKSINETKNDIMKDDFDEKEYNPFIVNKGLSLFPDTILYANDVNMYHQMPNRAQYRYLINSIRKGKRYAKWPKKDGLHNDIELISEAFNLSYTKAKEYLSILSDDDINEIRKQLETGGIEK